MQVVFKRPRNRQPSQPIVLDAGNPITKNIIAVVNPATGFIYAKGKCEPFGVANAGTITKVVGAYGVGINNSAGSTGTYRLNSIGDTTDTVWDIPKTKATWSAVFKKDSNTLGNSQIFSNCSANTIPYTPWGLFDSAGTGTIAAACDSGNAYKQAIGGAIVAGKTHVAVGRYDGAELAVFLDGKKTAATAASGNLVYFTGGGADARGTALLNYWNYTAGNRCLIGTVYLAVLWDDAVTDAQIASFSQNPNQIFSNGAVLFPAGASVSLPTIAYAASTTSAGAWTSTEATHHEAINEASYSDADYISVASASTCEMELNETAFPGGATQTVSYRASSVNSSTLTVELFQGATTIMTRTHSLTPTTTLYTQTLTSGEIADIISGAISVRLTSS